MWIDRFGARVVLLNDPAALRRVLVANADGYGFPAIRQRLLRPTLRDGLLTAEGEAWRRARRSLAPLFAPSAIRGLAPAMRDHAMAHASRYRDGARIDAADDMLDLAYDVMATTLFSGEIAGDPERTARRFERVIATLGRVDPLDLLGAPAWVPRPLKWRGAAANATLRATVRRTVRARRSMAGRGDLLDILLAAEREGGLRGREVEDNVITFMAAGHETTARALAWTLYCLARSPWDREGVEREIDGAWDALGAPDSWIGALPRTRAAFEEAMRLYPPVTMLSRHALAPDPETHPAIAAGTVVAIVPWTLHRHRALWHEPDAFRPERFWPGARESIDRYQYLPFGAGPRVCIGATFALWEGVIALAVLLRHYRFEADAGASPVPVQRVTTQPAGGLPMRVRLRRAIGAVPEGEGDERGVTG